MLLWIESKQLEFQSQGMAQSDKYFRSRKDLIYEFKIQERFVVSFMNEIAGRKFEFYKPLASTFRILFHHKGANKSLLKQLEMVEKIDMVSTCSVFDPSNIFPSLGLLGMRVTSDYAGYFPKEIPSEFKTVSFDKWWSEEIVLNDSEREKWTRKDLVMYAADQDGGSHVDPGIDKKYHQLAYMNSIGLKFFHGEGNEGINMENPIPACLWQIGLEFCKSMEIFRNRNSFV